MSDSMLLPKHPLFKNLTDARFGRLTVVRFAGRSGVPVRVLWECKCDCGTTITIQANRLQQGTLSCGCLHREVLGDTSRTHGKSKTPEYKVWAKMIGRCEDSDDKDYGGRGIRVCQRWRDSFEAFLSDMGERPSPGSEIDRIDNDGNYEPMNCRWVTRVQNARNKRNNRRLTYRGETLCISQWAEKLGCPPHIISTRLRRGWTVERALSTPLDNRARAL